MKNNPNVIKFLEELTELSKKYQIEIFGCGCCGSPSIQVIEKEKYWKGGEYEVNPNGDNLTFRK